MTIRTAEKPSSAVPRKSAGGTAEYVALYLKNIGHETAFYWYVTGCIFLSLMIYAFMRDTRDDSAMHRHV